MYNKNFWMTKIVLFVVVITLLSFNVLAAYGVPHQFYGDVTVNGAPAPNNLLIEARIQDAVYTAFTKDGKYGFNPIFYIEDPKSDRNSKSITFYVGTNTNNKVQAQSHVFSNGFVTNLNLVVTGLELSGSSGSSGSSGGAGGAGGAGGRGGSSTVINTTSNNETTDDFSTSSDNDALATSCEANWICGEWTECINFQQRRVCVDANNCNLADSPENRRSCDLTDAQLGLVPEKGFMTSFTGFVAGAGNIATSWIGLVVLLALIGSLFLFFFIKKKKN